jgi:hypothetical protein
MPAAEFVTGDNFTRFRASKTENVFFNSLTDALAKPIPLNFLKILLDNSTTFMPLLPVRKRIAKSSESESRSGPYFSSFSRGLSTFGKSFIFINLFFDHLTVFLFATNPNIILATINPDFLTLAVGKFFVGIPKNLISAMSAFIVSFLFSFVGDFLWHKFIFRFPFEPLKGRWSQSGALPGPSLFEAQ